MPSSCSLAAVWCALVTSTLAQTTSVTSLFLYGFEGDNIVASVLSAAPQSTEYFLTCAPGTDASDCGFGPGVTWTEGPSTMEYHLTESDAVSIDFNCAITSQAATCTETLAGSEANDPGVYTDVISDISDSFVPVTITAGLELLSGSSATATEASSTTGAPATGASATASAATKTESGTASGTADAGAATSSGAAEGAARRVGLDVAFAGLVGVVGVMMVL